MFCPKCATQNIDGASFCRVCGANISLVPQALSGQPIAVGGDSRAARRSRKRDGREPTIEHALKNVFVGIAFLLAAIALGWTGEGRFWWYWLLIPAFSSLGKGIGEYVKLREAKKQPLPPSTYTAPALAPPPARVSLPVRNTGELVAQPPSVTEGTTRHLGAEAPTRHLDSQSDYQK
ncbi:MAG: hypothetical protein JWM21_3496 [Acidobacteria bacterium]|nr:hypothetical protein [Acidobacteriota bacterium]